MGSGNALILWGRLLAPSLRSARNRLRRPTGRGVAKGLLFALAGAAVWAGVYGGVLRALVYFRSTEAVGDLLVAKLLTMLCLLFLTLLVYSNLVVSLSTLLLSKDLDLLASLPVPAGVVFLRQFSLGLLHSSWMFLLFGTPVFAAYASLYAAPPLSLLVLVVGLAGFLLIPACASGFLILVFGRIFPARRVREAAAVGGILLFAALYLAFRVLQPERLADPGSFRSLLGYTLSLQAPGSPALPSTWLSNLAFEALRGQWSNATFYLSLIVTTGASLTIVLAEVAARIYPSLLSRAQEAGGRRRRRETAGSRPLPVPLRWLPHSLGAVILKDTRTFLRDPTQWSQLVLVAALIIVYLYNFRVLPKERVPLPTFDMENLLAFVNLGLCGFVLVAVAARFVFPLLSLEGRSYWILRAAPMAARDILLGKLLLGLAPILGLGLFLTVASNLVLGSTRLMHVVSAGTTIGISVAAVTLALTFGILYPRFNIENAARIPTGVGGLTYMVTAMAVILAVLAIEAWPTYLLFSARYKARGLSTAEWAAILGLFSAAGILLAGVSALALHRGLRALARLEP
ncbi:MAG: hypothetical protein HYY13_03015 [Nitrospirae bacterium]|nr:hypothetical protein [Nitrospirota bacterium]